MKKKTITTSDYHIYDATSQKFTSTNQSVSSDPFSPMYQNCVCMFFKIGISGHISVGSKFSRLSTGSRVHSHFVTCILAGLIGATASNNISKENTHMR